MHALTILHRILSISLPEIHTKRLTSLLAAVEAVVNGSRLTLSDMGRGLSGPVSVKHNIKRIDRLLGNGALHSEVPQNKGDRFIFTTKLESINKSVPFIARSCRRRYLLARTVAHALQHRGDQSVYGRASSMSQEGFFFVPKIVI
jgi:hypothetical protein